MQAMIFVRPSGADGVGHVGWGIDCGDGTFHVGSIENPHHWLRSGPRTMGFWQVRTADPYSPMLARRYTTLKCLEVPLANPSGALRVVAWLSTRPYDIVLHNCMNATYDVLRAYGVASLPLPFRHWEPNGWFHAVHAPARPLGVPPAQATLACIDMPWNATPEAPAWRVRSTAEHHAFQQALAASEGAQAQRSLSAIIRDFVHTLVGG